MINKKGFTTIELFVMMTLLAIILVLIVPNFITYLDNSMEREFKSAVSTLEIAAEKYIDDNGGYEKQTGGLLPIYILLDEGYINDKLTMSLDKYYASGLAGTATTNHCLDIDAVNKKVIYNLSSQNGTCSYTWEG